MSDVIFLKGKFIVCAAFSMRFLLFIFLFLLFFILIFFSFQVERNINQGDGKVRLDIMSECDDVPSESSHIFMIILYYEMILPAAWIAECKMLYLNNKFAGYEFYDLNCYLVV